MAGARNFIIRVKAMVAERPPATARGREFRRFVAVCPDIGFSLPMIHRLDSRKPRNLAVNSGCSRRTRQHDMPTATTGGRAFVATIGQRFSKKNLALC